MLETKWKAAINVAEVLKTLGYLIKVVNNRKHIWKNGWNFGIIDVNGTKVVPYKDSFNDIANPLYRLNRLEFIADLDGYGIKYSCEQNNVGRIPKNICAVIEMLRKEVTILKADDSYAKDACPDCEKHVRRAQFLKSTKKDREVQGVVCGECKGHWLKDGEAWRLVSKKCGRYNTGYAGVHIFG